MLTEEEGNKIGDALGNVPKFQLNSIVLIVRFIKERKGKA